MCTADLALNDNKFCSVFYTVVVYIISIKSIVAFVFHLFNNFFKLHNLCNVE
jgi:hypothetical protein